MFKDDLKRKLNIMFRDFKVTEKDRKKAISFMESKPFLPISPSIYAAGIIYSLGYTEVKKYVSRGTLKRFEDKLKEF